MGHELATVWLTARALCPAGWQGPGPRRCKAGSTLDSLQRRGEAIMATAYYLRVSSKSQDTKSQEADMKAHAEREAGAVWYRDKFTGKTLTRPGWERLWADVLRVRWT